MAINASLLFFECAHIAITDKIWGRNCVASGACAFMAIKILLLDVATPEVATLHAWTVTCRNQKITGDIPTEAPAPIRMKERNIGKNVFFAFQHKSHPRHLNII